MARMNSVTLVNQEAAREITVTCCGTLEIHSFTNHLTSNVALTSSTDGPIMLETILLDIPVMCMRSCPTASEFSPRHSIISGVKDLMNLADEATLLFGMRYGAKQAPCSPSK